ncbi:MAG TPA: hypothetical protein VFH51_09585, partial [Myxococcota bacterium]|nr:hypothetical protein [Myxococcota bacterium]
MPDTPTQQMFDLWKRQIEEGSQAWARMLSQGSTSGAPATDPTAFWRPLIEQGFQQWARVLAQGPMTPDVLTQWKQLVDQAIEAWSRSLGQVMGTDAFAQSLGKSLDQFLATSAPMKKATEQSIETGLQALNLPSRAQLTGVAKQIVQLEERVEGLEDALAALPVYRTYIRDGGMDAADREVLEEAGLEGWLDGASPEFVTRFQQTTPPIMAKGVEDT